MICLHCHHAMMSAYEGHTQAGFVPCAQQIRLPEDMTVFESLRRERNCSKYQQASTEIVAKRVAWADAQ